MSFSGLLDLGGPIPMEMHTVRVYTVRVVRS